MFFRRVMLLTEIHRLQAMLLESRVDVLRDKFRDRLAQVASRTSFPEDLAASLRDDDGNIDPNRIFDLIAASDPDPTKKNTQWLLNLFVTDQMPIEDTEKATEYLIKFADKKKRRQLPPEHMDINRFKSLADLYLAIKDSDEKIVAASDAYHQKALAETQVLLDNAEYFIAIPKTEFSARYFGRGTEWCTTWGDPDGKYPTRRCMFGHYHGQGPLYIIHDKTHNRRWQFHFETNQFMDENDRQIDMPGFVRKNPTVMRAIGEAKFLPYIDKIGLENFTPSVLKQHLIYDSREVKAWRFENGFVALVGDKYVNGDIIDNKIAFVEGNLRHQVGYLARVLNAVGLEPTREFNSIATSNDLFYHDGRYGSPMDVGEKIFDEDGFSVYRVHSAAFVMSKSFWSDDSPAERRYGKDADYVSMRLDIDGKKLSYIDYNDARLTDEIIVKILNTVGVKPSESAEYQLIAFHVYYDGKRYGMLGQIGVKETNFGEEVLYRIGNRKKWIVTTDNIKMDASIVIGRSGELEADFGYHKATAAVRYLVQKYPVSKVKNSELYGVLNTAKGAIADIDTFVAGLSGIAPGIHQWEITDELRAFLQAHRDSIKPKQMAAISNAFRPIQTEPNWFEKVSEVKVFDLTVPTYNIHLPAANMQISDILGVPMTKTLKSDLIKAIKNASSFVDGLQAANFQELGGPIAQKYLSHVWRNRGDAPEGSQDIVEPLKRLQEKMDALQNKTLKMIADRRDNPERYAGDLSSRFAAMNAFRKMGSAVQTYREPEPPAPSIALSEFAKALAKQRGVNIPLHQRDDDVVEIIDIDSSETVGAMNALVRKADNLGVTLIATSVTDEDNQYYENHGFSLVEVNTEDDRYLYFYERAPRS